MSFMIAAGGLLVGVFILAYIRQGRYGLAALALVAGHTLAVFWADTLATTYKDLGVKLGITPWYGLLYAALVIVPMLCVLLFSKNEHGKVSRLLGAIVLGALSVVLLGPVLSTAAVMDAQSRGIYDIVNQYRTVFITGALVLALIDVIFSRAPKPAKHSKD